MPRLLRLPSAVPRARAAWGTTALLVALVAAVPRIPAQPVSPRRPSSLAARDWTFSAAPFGEAHAVVMTPAGLASGQRLPLLVALHGWGESQRGVRRGAWGWARDYELGASDLALRTPPLSRDAFLGCLSPTRFARLRADLAARPYRGLVVVAPFTPDALDQPERAAQFGEWLVNTLIPRARRELPVRVEDAATGIDGVSLGGLLALETALAHPGRFGAVGALQPAVRGRLPRVLGRVRAGASGARFRILTSDRDYLRRDVIALHEALESRRFAHEFIEVAGPHDYVFNRGPGGVEMLLFHDRALRGERPR